MNGGKTTGIFPLSSPKKISPFIPSIWKNSVNSVKILPLKKKILSHASQTSRLDLTPFSSLKYNHPPHESSRKPIRGWPGLFIVRVRAANKRPPEDLAYPPYTA